MELREREAGFGRLPPAAERLFKAGLSSGTLRSAALLTGFLGASVVRGRCRALGTGRGIPTSVAGGLDRRGMAGEEVPEVGPKESADKNDSPEETRIPRD